MRMSPADLLDFITRHAASRRARMLLYLFSALESVIIPVPVDPYLAVCVLARPSRWAVLALATAAASVIGGAAGWYLGFALQDFVAQAVALLPQAIAGEALFSDVSAAFNKLGLILVLIGAFTPLPYKIIAVSAGLFGYGLLPFILLSAVGRGIRFLLVAGLVAHRHDVKLVSGLASILLVLVCGGLYLTGWGTH